MNKEWSELNKLMQMQIKKEETWNDGVNTLFELRKQLFDVFLSLKSDLAREDFDAIPFINADGNHSTTIGWSLWHVFRIEDIVAHTLVADDEQVFVSGRYQTRIHPTVITTGNELTKNEMTDFSRQLDLEVLYTYMADVKNSTERLISGFPFSALKQKPSTERKDHLKALNVVSTHKDAFWLIDYWCGKDIRGLIQMPFSRHWIMHAEAILKIRNKLK